jgi:hypothetical protein
MSAPLEPAMISVARVREKTGGKTFIKCPDKLPRGLESIAIVSCLIPG